MKLSTGNQICCPPGKVHQPNGGLSTNGGLCCTESNVCLEHCCDGLPSFPLRCVKRGTGECYFQAVKLRAGAATTDSAGNVPVELNVDGKLSGTLSLVASGSRLAQSAASSSQLYGRAHFRARHQGRIVVKVRLTPTARKLLHRKHDLKAVALITLTEHGRSAQSNTSITISAPRRRR